MTARFVERMAASDWDGLASMMHPEALSELRNLLDPVLELPDATEVREALLGVSTPEELADVSDEAFFSRLIRVAMTQDPEIAEFLPSSTADVIGHVMEGDTAHVVARLSMVVEGVPFSDMTVVSFKQLDGVWMGLLTTEISGIANALRQAFEVNNEMDVR